MLLILLSSEAIWIRVCDKRLCSEVGHCSKIGLKLRLSLLYDLKVEYLK